VRRHNNLWLGLELRRRRDEIYLDESGLTDEFATGEQEAEKDDRSIPCNPRTDSPRGAGRTPCPVTHIEFLDRKR